MNQILAIVGSQLLTPAQSQDARWIVECILRSEHPRLVISGGAPGIDTIVANAVFAGKQWALEEFFPDVFEWEPRDGRKGFKARNIEIAEKCEEMVMIRSRQSQTYGSGWTADYAEGTLGKTVRRLYV